MYEKMMKNFADIITKASGIQDYIKNKSKEIKDELDEQYGSYEGDDDDAYYTDNQKSYDTISSDEINVKLTEFQKALLKKITGESGLFADIVRSGSSEKQKWTIKAKINRDFHDDQSDEYEFDINLIVHARSSPSIEVASCLTKSNLSEADLEKLLNQYSLIFASH